MTMTYPTNTEQLAAALNLSFGGLKTRFFRALKQGILTGPFSQKELRDDQVSVLVSLVANETSGETETERLETERLERLETERLAKLETERLAKLETERLAKLETERLTKLETERLAKLETERLAKLETERLAKLETEHSNSETVRETPPVSTPPIAETQNTEGGSSAAEMVGAAKYNKVPLGIFCFVMCVINMLVFVPKNWDAQPHLFTATFIICAIPCWMEYRFASILLAIETRNLSSSFLRLLRHQWMSLAVLVPAMFFQGFNLFELTWDVVRPVENPNHIALPYFMTVFQLYGLIETVNMQKK